MILFVWIKRQYDNNTNATMKVESLLGIYKFKEIEFVILLYLELIGY